MSKSLTETIVTDDRTPDNQKKRKSDKSETDAITVKAETIVTFCLRCSGNPDGQSHESDCFCALAVLTTVIESQCDYVGVGLWPSVFPVGLCPFT